MPQRQRKGRGRLVVSDRLRRVPHALTDQRALRGKFRILRHGFRVPAAKLLQKRTVHGKACADQPRGEAEVFTRLIEQMIEDCVIHGVAAADAALLRVFGGNAPFYHARAGRDGIVHARKKIGVDDVVRVKHAKCVVAARKQRLHRFVQRVSLAADRFKAAQDLCAGRACKLLGAVGAVVGNDIDVEQRGGIVLRMQAFHQRGDDGFFVACGDETGKACFRSGVFAGRSLFQREKRHDDEVKRE